jgi:hypothetical protein
MTPPISPLANVSPLEMMANAGFCKGAYYVQQGMIASGLKLATKHMEWSCHCKKCPFATPADHMNGRPKFDDRAHTTKNLRWRTLLLFKSHIISKDKKKRQYKCLMCVLMGNSAIVYDSEHDLFEHMIDHQGGALNGRELWGPLCLETTGVTIATENTFDVCFADNPRFALPASAFEMGLDTQVFEADSREVYR